MAVNIVTIHHEGAGTPSDDPRGASGGYTYWIGATKFEWLRSVYTSYATLAYNHVSLDICLSGNRMDVDVTDADIALIRGAFMDCRARGEVVDQPRVQFHRDNNGLYMFNGSLFSTVCPGDRAVAVRHQIEAACRFVPSAPEPSPAEIARLEALDKWRHEVHDHPLHFGDRGPNIAYLVDRLREHHFLHRGVIGDCYGPTLRTGVVKLKNTDPVLAKQPAPDKGEKFGGDAADLVVSLGLG